VHHFRRIIDIHQLGVQYLATANHFSKILVMLVQALVATLLPAVVLAVPAAQTTSNNGEDVYGIPSSVIETMFNVPA
jgi:hypothetical protein